MTWTQAYSEQRVRALEEVVQQLQYSNMQLQGALEEQRQTAQAAAAAAWRPAPNQREVVDTRLMGEPKNFDGEEDRQQRPKRVRLTAPRAYAGAISGGLLFIMLVMLLEDKAFTKVTLVRRDRYTGLWHQPTDSLEDKR